MHHTNERVIDWFFRPILLLRAHGLPLILLGLFGSTGLVVAVTPPSGAMSDGLTEVEMVAVMEVHYRSAIAGHDALIRGDLETLRRRIAELDSQPLTPAAPEAWGPFDQQLREAARGVATIESLHEAASAMAAVAEACGGCHAAVGAGKIYFWPAPSDGNGEVKTAMHNHQWASERLWEGVTGPFDEAWERGAKALANGRVFEGDVEQGLRARDGDLRDLGRLAEVMTGLHERALVYGRLLATCADCHREAGVTIRHDKSSPPWRR